MDNKYKKEVLEKLSLKKSKWMEIRGKEQDVAQADFVTNVILVLDWVMRDVERLEVTE